MQEMQVFVDEKNVTFLATEWEGKYWFANFQSGGLDNIPWTTNFMDCFTEAKLADGVPRVKVPKQIAVLKKRVLRALAYKERCFLLPCANQCTLSLQVGVGVLVAIR